jgi:hypothetical protein
MLTKNFTTMSEFDSIISIVCPDDDSIKPISENHLVVKMWDIDKPLENKFRKYEPPSIEDCGNILEEVDDIMYGKGTTNINILIHCDAGISRSSAISLGILWRFSGSLFDDENMVTSLFKSEYYRARKEYCASLVDTNNGSHFLKWFVEGKNLMRGVRPNQAILRIFRYIWTNFPW